MKNDDPVASRDFGLKEENIFPKEREDACNTMSGNATLYVDIVPSVLKWLRESIGLNSIDVGKELGIQPDIIDRWEKGDKQPTFDNILKLAEIYKRPVSAFYLPRPMEEPKPPKDYRRFSLKESRISPNDIYLIRKTQYLQEIANELFDELREDRNPHINNVFLNDDWEYVARYERQNSCITPEEQKGWQDHYEAFRSWKKFIESKNILVFQISFEERNIRGFALKDIKPYIIILNSASKEHISARIFTLLHEYAHILLQDSNSALCYPGDIPIMGRTKEDMMERWCDNFAGCFLMPRDQFLRDYSSRLDYEHVRWLSNKYRVSKLAVLTRLFVLNEIDWPQYEATKDAITQKDYKPIETKQGGKRSLVKETIREHGSRFCSLILEGNNKNIITTSDALDYLDIKLSNLPDLKKELSGNV